MNCPRVMKHITRFILVMAVLLVYAGTLFAAPQTLTVFAAASMTESMKQIAELYKKVAPSIEIVYNFDSSGTLKTQIEQGADCDIFISAGQKQMNELEKADLLQPGTRFDIVSNKVVLIVPKGRNPKKINDFKDAATDKVSLMALGNSDVPVGQYSEEIYKNLGLWDQLKSMKKITFGSNVKEVLSQVAAGAVDCGVVYSTDAATSKAVDVVAEAPAGSHKPITYPAAIMKKAKDESAAKAFVDFLKGNESSKVFGDIGFAIPQK